MTRPFPVLHSAWQKMKEAHQDVCVSSLSELPSKRSVALHRLQNWGEVWHLSSSTALQHDPSKFCSPTHVTWYYTPHSPRTCSFTLLLKTATARSPICQKTKQNKKHNKTQPRRFIVVRHHRTPKEIQEKHCVMWMFRLVPEVAGCEHCNTNQSLLPVLWARVQYYKSTYTVCYTFYIKRTLKIAFIHPQSSTLFFQSLSQIWC